MDGIEKTLDPGAPTSDPCADTGRAVLPRSLMDAVGALKASTLFREKMGKEFIDYIVAIKEFEVARFLTYVTDWEHREYFESGSALSCAPCPLSRSVSSRRWWLADANWSR